MEPWYKRNREEHNLRSRTWVKKNPEQRRLAQKQSNKRSRDKTRLLVLRHYSGNQEPFCICCGETILEFLTIDHINNDGRESRKKHGSGTAYYTFLVKNNYPVGYQVLCYNCNCARAKAPGKVCPHKQ